MEPMIYSVPAVIDFALAMTAETAFRDTLKGKLQRFKS